MGELVDLSSLVERVERHVPYPVEGSVTRVVGITAECEGVEARLGDLCAVVDGAGRAILAEVIGFRDEVTVLMPLDDLRGVGPGARVRPLGRRLYAPAGDALLGRVLDGIGRPLDDRLPPRDVRRVPVHRRAPSPARRLPIRRPYVSGVRAIDGLLTLGRGQRIGIFAGAGVGKSTLLAALAARPGADATVIALVGERGREVYDFVRDGLGERGLARSVVVAAPSDAPPLQRFKAPFVATAIAESFREEGRDVLLVMDSLTRFAAAAREVGLALGEPPTQKGYPPSLFSELPRLVERPGCFRDGAITAIYTVLVEGDDLNDPVADAVRSLLDGHIVLSRSLAERGHFPSVDVLQSVSRLMPQVVGADHAELARRFRALLATHRDHRDLIEVGAYKAGADPEVDRAVDRYPHLEAFLRQDLAQPSGLDETLQELRRALGAAS